MSFYCFSGSPNHSRFSHGHTVYSPLKTYILSSHNFPMIWIVWSSKNHAFAFCPDFQIPALPRRINPIYPTRDRLPWKRRIQRGAFESGVTGTIILNSTNCQAVSGLHHWQRTLRILHVYHLPHHTWDRSNPSLNALIIVIFFLVFCLSACFPGKNPSVSSEYFSGFFSSCPVQSNSIK